MVLRHSIAALLMLGFISVHQTVAASQPIFSDPGPEANAYGAAEGYPMPSEGSPTPAQKNIVGLFSHFASVTAMRTVARVEPLAPLKRAPEEIAAVYHYDGQQKSIRDYFESVTGLLIARGDTILYEHYQYARTDHDRLLSNSMAKTIMSMLVGIAIAEGAITSLDDMAAIYVSELANTEYGRTPLRALLQMSSGVAFGETYQPGDDITKFHGAVLRDDPVGAIAALKQFNTRDAPAGTRFSYSSAETEVLGLVVSRAVRMPLADYLSTRIWSKLGAEVDAAWAIDPTGQEAAYCCFIARLRDWAGLD
jgi:CubicO group peptidase (beta-lactamase class C family)